MASHPTSATVLRGALAIGILAFAIRMAVLAVVSDAWMQDPDAYRSLARVWASTGTFGTATANATTAEDRSGAHAEPGAMDASRAVATAYRPPLYPWLLSWAYYGADRLDASAASPSEPPLRDRAWIAFWHIALGTATSILTWLLAMRLGLRPWAGAMGAMLVIFDPILLRQSTLVMTETLATCLGVVAWWWAVRHDATRQNPESNTRGDIRQARFQSGPSAMVPGLILGSILGAAGLCRATALAWLVVWGGLSAMLWWRSPAPDRNPQSFRTFAIAAVVACLMLGGWAWRNQQQLGTPVLTTTHGGYTLYLANNPILYDHWKRSVSRDWDEDAFHRDWQSDQQSRAFASEMEMDRFAQSLAMQSIREEPGTFLWGCVIRQGWFWALWPASRQASLWQQRAIGIWYAVVLGWAALGGVLLARSRGSGKASAGQSDVATLRRWLPAVALLVSLVLVHSVYWSNMRMRAPLVPMLSLLAAVGVQRLVGHLATARSGGQKRSE